ncbi:MAG: 30S ribosomal protein S9 [Bacteroidales bacterium]|nr:30S ribosomal protein S9 [Bacteroidales bacterium]
MDLINTVGRRKTAVARIYMKEGPGNIIVNKKDYKVYFPTPPLQYTVKQAFETTNTLDKFDIQANISGGGVNGQAEALRLAIARALVKYNEELKPPLKAIGLMTRDSRMVERKKPGQKKARKRFQFSKR